jgi:hypothetical protein
LVEKFSGRKCAKTFGDPWRKNPTSPSSIPPMQPAPHRRPNWVNMAWPYGTALWASTGSKMLVAASCSARLASPRTGRDASRAHQRRGRDDRHPDRRQGAPGDPRRVVPGRCRSSAPKRFSIETHVGTVAVIARSANAELSKVPAVRGRLAYCF